MSSAHLIVVRHLWVLRRGRPWNLLLEGIFEPFLYLLSVGLGIGQLVGGVGATQYAAFVAPALLATSAMNSAIGETTGSFWWRARFDRFYDAIVTTPMRVTDIAVGETAASVLRRPCRRPASSRSSRRSAWCGRGGRCWRCPRWSWWRSPSPRRASLVATLMRDLHHTQYLQLGMLPMFLFATTFFPLSVYPGFLQPVVAVLPLYQAIELIRGLTTGVLGPACWWRWRTCSRWAVSACGWPIAAWRVCC